MPADEDEDDMEYGPVLRTAANTSTLRSTANNTSSPRPRLATQFTMPVTATDGAITNYSQESHQHQHQHAEEQQYDGSAYVLMNRAGSTGHDHNDNAGNEYGRHCHDTAFRTGPHGDAVQYDSTAYVVMNRSNGPRVTKPPTSNCGLAKGAASKQTQGQKQRQAQAVDVGQERTSAIGARAAAAVQWQSAEGKTSAIGARAAAAVQWQSAESLTGGYDSDDGTYEPTNRPTGTGTAGGRTSNINRKNRKPSIYLGFDGGGTQDTTL